MDFRGELFINGEWRQSSNGNTFPVHNPANNELVVEVARATSGDIEHMVDHAADAQEEWGALPGVDRSVVMMKAVEIFNERIDELASVLSIEQGKPLEEAKGEWRYGIDFIAWFAEESRRVYGTTIPSSRSEKRIITIRQPLGVTACITPWNFPALQILRKLGAALAAGCTMIVKPPEQTPLSALEIARVFQEAGLPKGVLQIATTDQPQDFTAVIMKDTRVRGISFTGSTAVGKYLMEASASTLKKVSLELGGHAPFIVFEDADLEVATSEAVTVKTRNMGQTCVSPNRFYVHESIQEEFTKLLKEKLSALKVGDPQSPETAIGPLIEERALEKVERHIADAKEKGGDVILGGSRHDVEGGSDLYFSPTIISGANEEMLLFHEETFGPVVPIFSFKGEEEVIQRANDSAFGLAGYFFTQNLNRIIRVGEKLELGTVGINDASISAVQAPFGGVKESGIGREGGSLGIDEYLETKYISIGNIS